MTERERVEEALRLPAPDEPAALPPLGLEAADMGQVRGRVRGGPAGGRLPGLWPLLAIVGVLAAILTWQLAGIGRTAPTASMGPGGSPSAGPSDSGPADGSATFHGGGLSFTYPSAWRTWTSRQVSTMGSSIVILGTADLSACGLISTDINCAYATVLAPGQVLVFVGTGASPGGSIKAPPGGFVDHVDGMPAVVQSVGPIAQTRQDESRDWQIGMPGVTDNWYTVSGSMRGPGTDRLRAQVDALVRSIRFDRPAPSLANDPAALDRIVKLGIDAIDRGARENYHSRFYACFPRSVGSSKPTTIEDGPGGPLIGPITVICSVEITTDPVGLYAMTLSASWDAGPGYAAGVYRELDHLDEHGAWTSMQTLTDSFFPATAPEVTPAPATTPIALAPGSLVEVLYPGVTFYLTPDRNGDTLSDLPFGERLWIVDGPRHVAGEDWYRVQWTPTPTYGGIPGWMPATEAGHPVVAPVAPRCQPTVAEVIDLVDLHPAERLECFGDRPITLGPVILESEPNKTFPSTGTPAWLAQTATIAMFGSDGPAGVDGPLLVRGDPSLASLPVGAWLEITGHFDDPAARECTRSWVGSADSVPSPESPAEQVLGCREQFVIGAVKTVAAP